MRVYVVMESNGWPEDGDSAAGVYSSRELAEQARTICDGYDIVEIELDVMPKPSVPYVPPVRTPEPIVIREAEPSEHVMTWVGGAQVALTMPRKS